MGEEMETCRADKHKKSMERTGNRKVLRCEGMARRGGDALMNGYEKQWNSSEMLGLGKVQLGDARALTSEVKEKSRDEPQWICAEKQR